MMRKMSILVFSIALIFAISAHAEEKSKPKKVEKSTSAKKETIKPKSEVQKPEGVKPASEKVEDKKIEHRWVNIFPIGTSVSDLKIDPQDPNILYAVTPKGLFMTRDSGKLWTPLSQFGNSGFIIIAVSPRTFYWATNDKLWKLKDGGITWEDISGGIIGRVSDFAINPKSPEIIYVVSGGIYKTLNGGKTWGEIGKGGQWLYLNPDSPEELYVCCEEEGDSGVLFRMLKHSINGGQSFELVRPYTLDNEGKKKQCWSWYVTFTGSEMISTCMGSGYDDIIKSSDGGKTWEAINNEKSTKHVEGNVKSGIFHPKNKDVIYFVVNGPGEGEGEERYKFKERHMWGELYRDEILKSTDGGKTWETLPFPPYLDINDIKISSSNTVYVTTDHGIWKSADEKMWELASFGLPVKNVGGAILENTGGDIIYVGKGGHYWTSNDKGASWTWHSLGSYSLALSQKFTTPDKTVWELFTHENGGKLLKTLPDQQSVEIKTPQSPSYFAVSSDSKIVYILTKNKTIFKSEDSGFSWAPITAGDIASFVVNPQSPDIVYAVVNNGVLIKTTDGGKTWTDIGGGLYNSMRTSMQSIWSSSKWLNPKERSDIANRLVSSITSVVIDPSNSNIVYIITSTGGVYRSDDGGKNWKLKSPNDYLKTLVSIFDNYSDQKCKEKGRKDCKVTLYNSTIMKSWQVGFFINVPPNYVVVRPEDILKISGVSFNNISINPSDSKTVYLATNVGVYRSSDRGDTWYLLNQGFLEPAVKKVIASPSIVLAEGESGIYKLTELPPAEKATTIEQYIAIGERIFNGKGTCTLCHNPVSGRAPLLDKVGAIAEERLKDPRYKGKAKTGEEYIHESMVDPSAYVVAGFGKPGTNDTVSRMLNVSKGAIGLSDAEMGAIIAYLQQIAGVKITVKLPMGGTSASAAAPGK